VANEPASSLATPLYRARWLQRIRTPLAVAASCGVAVAGCGATHYEKILSTGRHFSTTPGAAAALLAGLPTPPGFTRSTHCALPPVGADTVCFTRPRSEPLDMTVMTAFLHGFGAKLQTKPFPTSCSPSHLAPRHLAFEACDVLGTLGPNELSLVVTSIVWVGSTSATGTTQPNAEGLSGIEVHVRDVGQ
jgi:hypothetical protein